MLTSNFNIKTTGNFYHSNAYKNSTFYKPKLSVQRNHSRTTSGQFLPKNFEGNKTIDILSNDQVMQLSGAEFLGECERIIDHDKKRILEKGLDFLRKNKRESEYMGLRRKQDMKRKARKVFSMGGKDLSGMIDLRMGIEEILKKKSEEATQLRNLINGNNEDAMHDVKNNSSHFVKPFIRARVKYDPVTKKKVSAGDNSFVTSQLGLNYYAYNYGIEDCHIDNENLGARNAGSRSMHKLESSGRPGKNS